MREVYGAPGENLERLAAFVRSRGIQLSYNENIAPALGMSYGGHIALLPGQSKAEEFSTLVSCTTMGGASSPIFLLLTKSAGRNLAGFSLHPFPARTSESGFLLYPLVCDDDLISIARHIVVPTIRDRLPFDILHTGVLTVITKLKFPAHKVSCNTPISSL